jgi:hypothetical protein
MDALAAAKSLPPGITRDLVVSCQKDLDTVTQGWNEATAAYRGGDVPRAVKMARDVMAQADALAGALGLHAAPAAVGAK